MEPEYFFRAHDTRMANLQPHFFLFFDFDGTLAPIRDNPAHCVLSPEIKSRLEGIVSSGRARVALLTGRPVKDIKKRAPLQDIYFGGSHGLEIAGPGLTYVHPQALRGNKTMEEIRSTIEIGTQGMEGVFIEKKRFGFSLHYRMADRETKASARKLFYRTVAESTDSQSFSVLRGKKVLELVPKIQWDKGSAALFLLERFNKNFLPVYVGDDVTDEAAFRALKVRGVTIRIGKSKRTEARYYLKGQWQIVKLLQYIHNLVK